METCVAPCRWASTIARKQLVLCKKCCILHILGFPSPAVPDFHNMQNYIVDAFIAAILSFVFSAVMCKIFARKYRYEIDPNQVNTLFVA